MQNDRRVDAACVADKSAWLRVWQQSRLFYPWCVACNRWLDAEHLAGATHSKRQAWEEELPANSAFGPSDTELAEAERALLASQGPRAWATARIADVAPSNSASYLPPPDSALTAWDRPFAQLSVVNVD